MILLERLKLISTLAPIADAFEGTAGTVTSDAVNMKLFQSVMFVVLKGVGLTGTSTWTVEKCTLANGTGAEAIPFYYKRIQANEAESATTLAAAAGFASTAGSDELYAICVDHQTEGLAEGDKPYVRLKGIQVVDSPVAGAILTVLGEPRYSVNVAALA